MWLNIRNLSEDARETLKKAAPYTQMEKFWEDKTYIDLYKQFLGNTKYLKERPTFNDFNGAAAQMKKHLFLGYKEYRNGGEIWRKNPADFVNRHDYQEKSQDPVKTPPKAKRAITFNFKGKRIIGEMPSK